MLKPYTQRHQRARLAVRKTYWELNDHPDAFRQSIQLFETWTSEGSGDFGRAVYSHAELDQATEGYIAHCRKKGFWEICHNGGQKFDLASLQDYRETVKAHHQRLADILSQQAEKNLENGHIKASNHYVAASAAESDCWRSLREYVVAKAKAGEIASFTNYVVAVGNNDAEFHVAQIRARSISPAKVPVSDLTQILELSNRRRDESLRIIQKALKRLALEKATQTTAALRHSKGPRRPLRRAA